MNDTTPAGTSSPSRSPSTSSRISTSSWTTARPRKSGRWRSRPARSSTPTSPSPRPACACRCSSAMPRRSMSSSRSRSRSSRRARRCARRPACRVVDHREDDGYVTPGRVRRRGRRLCQPHPQGPDGRARPLAVGRLRQSAQGRRAQRRADRRASRARLSHGRPPLERAQAGVAQRTRRGRNGGSRGSSWSCAAMICSSAAPIDAASTP